jgi:hypothetical protein
MNFDLFKKKLETVKDTVAKHTVDGYQIITEKIDVGKSQLIKNIQTYQAKDLYDYSNTPNITLFQYQDKVFSLKNFLAQFTLVDSSQNPNLETHKQNIATLKPEEKIVIFMHNQTDDHIDTYILVTNYGRYLSLETNNNNYNIKSTYHEFNIWLPVDYIGIINKLYGDPENSILVKSMIPASNVYMLLEYMREFLYNRRYEPNYVKELRQELENLKLANAQMTNNMNSVVLDRNKLQMERAEFEKQLKPYIDIEKEDAHNKTYRLELDRERDKLKVVAIKLELEKKKLADDMEKIKNLDINQILNS